MVLLAITVFFFSINMPGDEVEVYLEFRGYSTNADNEISREDYISVAKSLDLHLPEFYFSITPQSTPPNIDKYIITDEKKLVSSIYQYNNNWKATDDLFQELIVLMQTLEVDNTKISQDNSNSELKKSLLKLKKSSDHLEFDQNFKVLEAFYKANKDSLSGKELNIEHFIEKYNHLPQKPASIFSIFPKFTWNGTENRFHRWFSNALKFDFGTSSVDGRKVSVKIKKSLKWTLMYVFLAYILTFGLAIPIALLSTYHNKNVIAKLIDNSFIAIYSIPVFWLATLAVVFLTSSEVTGLFNIFPSIGIGEIYSDMSFGQQLKTAMPHLILPAIVVAFHTRAYIIDLVKKNMQKEMKKKYYLSLMAQGLPRKKVIFNHIFPNSLLPLITMIVVGLPASIAGSVIIEVIFNIPGMGRLLYDAILQYDWNVVYSIVLLIGVATYIFYFIGDMLYSYFDSRIKFIDR